MRPPRPGTAGFLDDVGAIPLPLRNLQAEAAVAPARGARSVHTPLSGGPGVKKGRRVAAGPLCDPSGSEGQWSPAREVPAQRDPVLPDRGRRGSRVSRRWRERGPDEQSCCLAAQFFGLRAARLRPLLHRDNGSPRFSSAWGLAGPMWREPAQLPVRAGLRRSVKMPPPGARGAGRRSFSYRGPKKENRKDPGVGTGFEHDFIILEQLAQGRMRARCRLPRPPLRQGRAQPLLNRLLEKHGPSAGKRGA